MKTIGPITILTKSEDNDLAVALVTLKKRCEWLESVVQGYIRLIDTATDALVAFPCECEHDLMGEFVECQRCKSMRDVQSVLGEHFEVIVDGA